MRKFFLLSTLMCLVASLAWTQNMQLTGRVLATENGAGLSGASVAIKGTTKGVITDADGKFTINIPAKGRTVLVISSVGFVNQEISVDSQKPLTINLVEEVKSLDDIVVVGYG